MTDPRYDPRYQRDWDGSPPLPDTKAPVSPPAGAAFPPRPASAPAPIAPPVGDASDAPSVTAPDPDDVPIPSGRNPYRMALVIGGIALLAIAAGLVWRSAQPTSSHGPQSTIDYVLISVEQGLMPFFFLTGLMSLIVAIALGALVHRR